MFDGMLQDMKDGNGFTVPCNTKKQAERIYVQLQAMTTDNPALRERFKLYTSDQGKAPADVDTEWSKNWVVYSPTITTQIAPCVVENEAATASPCNPQKLDGLHLHPFGRSFREAFYHQEKDT